MLALTGRISAISLNQHSSMKTWPPTEDELEQDNGDEYMNQSIAEAEKEVADKKGSIDL